MWQRLVPDYIIYTWYHPAAVNASPQVNQAVVKSEIYKPHTCMQAYSHYPYFMESLFFGCLFSCLNCCCCSLINTLVSVLFHNMNWYIYWYSARHWSRSSIVCCSVRIKLKRVKVNGLLGEVISMDVFLIGCGGCLMDDNVVEPKEWSCLRLRGWCMILV